MSKKRPTARTARREQERAMGKLVREREKLAALVPGGSPTRSIEVGSASVIEVQARATPCPLCGGELRVEDHAARTIGRDLLRVVRVRCFQCGAPRELFFRLTLPH